MEHVPRAQPVKTIRMAWHKYAAGPTAPAINAARKAKASSLASCPRSAQARAAWLEQTSARLGSRALTPTDPVSVARRHARVPARHARKRVRATLFRTRLRAGAAATRSAWVARATAAASIGNRWTAAGIAASATSRTPAAIATAAPAGTFVAPPICAVARRVRVNVLPARMIARRTLNAATAAAPARRATMASAARSKTASLGSARPVRNAASADV